MGRPSKTVGAYNSVGVRFMIGGDESGGGFALVEHPIVPHGLAAPLHCHSHEDEYSYVLEGRVEALLGGEVVYGEPGDLIFKPRGQWHTFWHAGDEPARLLEIIAPAGFERFFAEMTAGSPPDPAAMVAGAARYGAEVDLASVPKLIEEYGLVFGPSAH